MATRTASRSSKSAKSASNRKERYETLHELLIMKMQVLHDVENQIIKALPKMAKAATSPELKSAFETHLEETKIQEQRIDEALEMMGDTGKGKMESEGIRGIIADGEWAIKNIKNPEALDAALIADAQSVEHYEIAGYGAAVEWAEEMGHTEITDLLHLTLEEEKATDEKLTALAESDINEKVEMGMEEEK